MRRLDPTVGPRAATYAHYRRLRFPQFSLGTAVPVATARLKEEGGLFPNLLWAALEAINAVPELRQRIRVEDGRDVIVEHERVDCTCTAARPDGSFEFCAFPSSPDRAAFLTGARERLDAAARGEGLDLSEQTRDDMAYLSSVPWFEVHGVQHAHDGDPLDCIPRVLWGRVVDDRLLIHLTAHHALADGRHMGLFFAEFARRVA